MYNRTNNTASSVDFGTSFRFQGAIAIKMLLQRRGFF